MSITANFPAIRPTLNLDFVNSHTVDPRITFTRASTATYFDRFGVLRTAAVNEPRIDFDPATGECKGLLIEEQRTNLLTYSEEFDNAAWTRFDVGVTTNAAIAPSGAMTADKLIPNSGIAYSTVRQAFTATDETVVTLSIFFRAAEFNTLRLGIRCRDNVIRAALFNASNGVVSGVASGYTASMQPVGNGFFRASLSGSVGTGSTTPKVLIYAVNDSNSYILGDGTSGIYIWGAQLEVGAFPTSYIPTTSSQVTRSADITVMTGTNFSSWYRQDEGTFLADIERPFADSSNRFSFAVFADASNYLGFDYSKARAGSFFWRNGDAGATSTLPGTTGSLYRYAAAYGADGYALTANGMSVVSGVSDTPPPSVNTLNLGQRAPGEFVRGLIYFKRLTYYPARLPNNQLQVLTA